MISFLSAAFVITKTAPATPRSSALLRRGNPNQIANITINTMRLLLTIHISSIAPIGIRRSDVPQRRCGCLAKVTIGCKRHVKSSLAFVAASLSSSEAERPTAPSDKGSQNADQKATRRGCRTDNSPRHRVLPHLAHGMASGRSAHLRQHCRTFTLERARERGILPRVARKHDLAAGAAK